MPFTDPYIDPNSGILRNRFNVKDLDELSRIEADYAAVGITELIETDYQLTYTIDDFKFIHKLLFQDVYDWAGEIRTVEIRKLNRSDSEIFAPSALIEQNFFFSMQELADDKNLKGLTDLQFAKRLAYHFNNINYIHPFREGNGRTQRVFWSLAAKEANHLIDWRLIDGEEMNRASEIGRMEFNTKPLEAMFAKIVSHSRKSPSLDEVARTLMETVKHLPTDQTYQLDANRSEER